MQAASKAADDAADKALESVGSQVADSSEVAARGSDHEQVPTGLGAETDKDSDKPAVQALANGMLLL